MKRLMSICLAVVMMFSMTTNVFAQGIIPAVDKTIVKKGDQVVVTTTMEETVSGVVSAEFRLAYDEDLFEFDYDQSVPGECDIAKSGDVGGQTWNGYVKCTYSYTRPAGGTINAGAVLATLKFTAKKDVTEDKEGTFTSSVYTFAKTDGSHPVDEFTNKSISVTVTPASAEAKGYSMEVKAENPNVVVGEEAQVSLKITNSDPVVTTYNAYYAEVTYDKDSLTYTSSNLAADAVDSSKAGTLKITGYGDDKICGTDDIVLTFKTTEVGTPKVTVTSAKVDAKANAKMQNAPTATLTTAEATIKVGGYMVTLPEGFTGPTTVNPGENYTFTAKDTSKKYDFSGSTMGGNAVTITDKGNGTYMIENVNGALVIKATEKVKIKLSGKAVGTITSNSWENAAEVEAGKALWFMATPDPGKELVVTVNGEVITGINQQGQMRYTITADKVTGPELNIDVNYKAENKVTIIEEGDAWDDLENIQRGGYEKSGDQVAKDVTYSLQFNIKGTTSRNDTIEALKNYTITINGVEAKSPSIRRNMITVAFQAEDSQIVDGKIVINISRKKTEPTYTVDVSEYLKLDGQTMYLVTATGEVAEDKVLAYDGNQMYWSEKYNGNKGAYAWLIIPDKTKSLDELKKEAQTAIKAVDGTRISINYSGDVNLTNAVDINDAQFVWNMYNAVYRDDTTFQTVNRQKYLTADVNHDGVLDTKDAAAVVGIIKK